MKILVTGATGLIGSHLVPRLLNDGHTVTALSRSPQNTHQAGLTWRVWDGKTVPAEAGAVDAVINLAGTGIADKRWTAEYKKSLRDSRIWATQACVQHVRNHSPACHVFLQASAVGFYGTRSTAALTETAPAGTDFLGKLCVEWEDQAKNLPCRTVWLRTGIVLAREGGALPKLLQPFKYYAGAWLGSGRQPFPWVHIADVVEAYCLALTHATMAGPINVVAPEAHTNKSLAQLLGKRVGIPVLVGLPGLLVKSIMGERAYLLLEGQNVQPKRLLAEFGFRFRFEKAEAALADLVP